MQKNAVKNSASRPIVFPIVFSIIVAEIITFLLALIVASTVPTIDDYENVVFISSFFCSGIGAFFGGLLTSMAFRREKYIMSLVCGFLLCIILVIVNIIFYREPVTTYSFIKYGVIIFSAFISSFLIKTRRRVRRKIV